MKSLAGSKRGDWITSRGKASGTGRADGRRSEESLRTQKSELVSVSAVSATRAVVSTERSRASSSLTRRLRILAAMLCSVVRMISAACFSGAAQSVQDSTSGSGERAARFVTSPNSGQFEPDAPFEPPTPIAEESDEARFVSHRVLFAGLKFDLAEFNRRQGLRCVKAMA
jgi:hypothetical protein